MDFSINFMNRVSAVLKEACLLKKYKAMPLVLAIFVGIFMLPLVFASLVCAGVLYLLGYLFSVVSLPVQSLHKLLKEEGQSVQHGAQVAIYLVSWGFVFGAYAALTFFLVTLTVLYSLFSIITYLCTLGGFKFHLFAKDEDISVEVTGKYNTLIPVIFIVIMGVLLLILPLINTISLISKFGGNIPFDTFIDIYVAKIQSTGSLRSLVAAVYSAILFAPGPKNTEE